MTGASLKIHCPSLVGTHATIELNGMDITACCQGLILSMACNDVTRATITVQIDQLDVTAETLALLEAYLNKQET